MDDQTSHDAAANPGPTFDLGAWIGRGQAFSLVANHCSAAQAECLARIREDGLHKALNLTWDEFCTRHAGASRERAAFQGLIRYTFNKLTRVARQAHKSL